MNEKIKNILSVLSSYEKLMFFRNAESKSEKKEDKKKGVPTLEGISFRFKTVQFHLIDDCFQEIKKSPEVFGDVEILSERFSLPDWGLDSETFKKNEYQFEIIAKIVSKVDKDMYQRELEKVIENISEKHEVDADIKEDEEYFNVNKITFHTSKEGVFEKG